MRSFALCLSLVVVAPTLDALSPFTHPLTPSATKAPGPPLPSPLPSPVGAGGPGAGVEVGAFEVEVPAAADFLLHGTLPLLPSTYPRADGLNPFAIREFDGTVVPCQVEVVSRYPGQFHGADVVELLARVRRNPSLAPGSRTTYPVVVGFSLQTIRPANPNVGDLLTGPDTVLGNVVALLTEPASLEIAVRDVFGHRYSVRPLEAQGGIELERYGAQHTQVRTYGTMLPDNPVGGSSGTLPHMMGVHAYVSALSGEHVVLLDIRVHNGFDDRDGGTNVDDQVNKVYWDSLDLVVPNGWVVQQAIDDPYWGSVPPVTVAGRTTYRVVEPLPGNELHVMDVGAQFHRRLALCPPGYEAVARSLLDQEGLGFCTRGHDPATGVPYASWWNPFTARYFPQSFILPSLDHVGIGGIRNLLTNDLQKLESMMANGTGTGMYPVKVGALGWAHPYGNQYGGMTGGSEIYLWDGVRTACAASRDGYRGLQITHRMQTDRQADVIYAKDGDPTRVEDWLKGPASDPYVDFQFFLKVIAGDPFKYSSAPTFQVNAVAAQGRQPSYEAALLAFEPHDQSHMVRYTRSPKVLVWLGNDRLARDDVEMQSELCRLSYHPYPNSSGGYLQQSSMAWDIDYVKKYPNAGFRFGRFEGWGIDTVNVAYATGDDAFRQDVKPWFDEIRDMVVDGQASCSGFLQANISPQFLNGLYRARNNIEQAIAENGLHGMLETVYALDDAASTAMLRDVLRDSFYSWFNIMSWDPSKKGPWAKAAVGPLDESLPPWCAFVPPNGNDGIIDTYQLWSSLAYGAVLSGKLVFFKAAAYMLGGSGPLLTKLENQGTNNIENRAAMLALVQFLHGVL